MILSEKNQSISFLLKPFTKAPIAPANIHINFTIPYQRCLNSNKLGNTKNINSKNYTLAEETVGVTRNLKVCYACLTYWCHQGNTNKGRLTWKYLKGFLITETETRNGVGCRRKNLSRHLPLVLQTAIAGHFLLFFRWQLIL